MDRRTKNVIIFNDTMSLIEEKERLKQATELAIKSQKLYLEKDEIELPESANKQCKVIVSSKRSYEAASVYAKAGKKVAVLNFASANNPGGGVTRGSTAQEECLCRCSSLYACLNTREMYEKFYKPHRIARDTFYNDDCIYTPNVFVYKSDIDFPELMEEKDWYQLEVITCAAPNLRNLPYRVPEIELSEIHEKRIEKIFKVAIDNGVEVLILGAFGCGAFSNPPRVVANAFKKVQEKYASYFETIEYAVYCGRNDTTNYDTFSRVLK